MNKKCYTCQTLKAITEFNKNKSRKDGLNSICKDCSKTRSKQYYHENHDKHCKTTLQRSKKQKEANKQFIFDFLLRNPCVDCGEKDPIVLEFDHQRDKKKLVSRMALEGYSQASLMEEINKCIVRCANCHRRKTAKDFGYYTFLKSNT